MTREEAIAYGKRVINLGLNDETQAFCEVALKALKQEPCEDCVSRQAVIDMTGLSEWFDSSDSYNEFVIALSELPLVTPQPKTGHWEKTTDDYCYWYRCSCCGTKAPKNGWGSDYFSPYCPNCGAKMVQSEDI